MISSLILTLVLRQVPPTEGAPRASQPENAAVWRPSDCRMLDLQHGVERRKERRARAAAARRMDKEEARRTDDRLAQVTTAPYQKEFPMSDARHWIEALRLVPQPEGGFYRETYRTQELIPRAGLPERFPGDRAFSTSIYFLLEATDFSSLHRLKQDEVWHFYDGSSLTVHVLDPAGANSKFKLGRRFEKRETLQAVVTAACWFGATVDAPGRYAIVGVSSPRVLILPTLSCKPGYSF